jgi:hypothetical protein
VLSPRPARIQAAFDVNIPHPRRLTSPEAQALRLAVLRELGVLNSSSRSKLGCWFTISACPWRSSSASTLV